MTGTFKGLPAGLAGYTLVELLVAIGIFSVVVVMVAGLISRVVFIERRNIAEQALEEDLRFALELFSRETRLAFASTFALADDTGRSLLMRNQNGACVNYRLGEENVFERAEADAQALDCAGADFGDRYSPLTSRRIRIEKLRFDLPDNVYNQGDNQLDRQGFVTIIVKARAVNTSTPAVELQTTVTSRQVKAYEIQ